VSTPTPTKKTSTRRRAKRPPADARTSKNRVVDKKVDEAQDGDYIRVARRLPSGKPEQLMILVGALIFGLIGLFVHILILVSVVLMALLLGLIASEARNQGGRGIVSDVTNEAKVVIGELRKPGRVDTDDLVVQGEDSSGQTE
jgi:hypothetical protein